MAGALQKQEGGSTVERHIKAEVNNKEPGASIISNTGLPDDPVNAFAYRLTFGLLENSNASIKSPKKRQ
jgi:hypothetical protein